MQAIIAGWSVLQSPYMFNVDFKHGKKDRSIRDGYLLAV